MRIKVTIKTSKLPIIYRHRFISLIKECLKISDFEYKENLYKNKFSKPFTFSLLMPSTKQIKKEEIKIDNSFTIVDGVFYFTENMNLFISSSDYEFIMHLYNGLLKLKTFDFSSENEMLVNSERIYLEIKEIELLNDKKIKSNTITFKTNSPVIIEDEQDKPVSYDSEKINDYINKITNTIFKSTFKRELNEKLYFEFDKNDLNKQVIKHTLKDFRLHTQKPLMFLTGFRGKFKLSGHEDDLTLIYKTGLGNKTNQGFGMLDIVGQGDRSE